MITALTISLLTMSPPKRAHHALVYDDVAKKILMMGGSTPLNGGQSFEFFNDIWSFDGKDWTRAGEAGDKRSGISLAFDTKRGHLYSYGGFTGDNQSRAELRVLKAGAWLTISNDPAMKAAEGCLVYDSKRDCLVAFGGSAGRGLVSGTTFEWDLSKGGTPLLKGSAASGPEARQGACMVFDSKRGKTVLFGGSGAAGLCEGTWEYDGTWKKVATNVPAPRGAAGCAFDSERGQTVMFGGMTKDGFKGDTWGWDGITWVKLAESGPPARAMGYMAYDKARKVCVLFGGRLGWPNDAQDTWEWNGKEWHRVI